MRSMPTNCSQGVGAPWCVQALMNRSNAPPILNGRRGISAIRSIGRKSRACSSRDKFSHGALTADAS